jgi:hypothetical protein
MVAANKQVMDAMFECIYALIAGHSKAADKVIALIPNSNTGRAPSTTSHKKKRCTNCKKLVFHKRETCYELKINASKCYSGWNSCKNASASI